MSLLFAHDPKSRFSVILSWRCREKMILLLHRGELRIALDANHCDNRISDVLLGYLHPSTPLRHPFKISEFNSVSSRNPIESNFKSIISKPSRIESNSSLPFVKLLNPAFEVWSIALDNLSLAHDPDDR